MLGEFGGKQWANTDSMLDVNALGVILTEIIVGSDVILCCHDSEQVNDLITRCEEYIDKDLSKLLHELIDGCKDSGLKSFLDDVLS